MSLLSVYNYDNWSEKTKFCFIVVMVSLLIAISHFIYFYPFEKELPKCDNAKLVNFTLGEQFVRDRHEYIAEYQFDYNKIKVSDVKETQNYGNGDRQCSALITMEGVEIPISYLLEFLDENRDYFELKILDKNAGVLLNEKKGPASIHSIHNGF